jgi:hypothetical protein
MARVNILGRSGVGKSWFSGWVLEQVLLPGVGDDPELEDADDESGLPNPMNNEENEADTMTPDFGEGDGSFEYAVHIDVEDEEQRFSAADDPVLLTYTATQENIRKAVQFSGDAPDYIPENALEDGDTILLPQWVLYKNKYVRVVPEGLTDEELQVLVEMLADAAMKAEDTHFSLDEAHLVARKHGIGKKLMRLVTGGRKRAVEWVFITQRPQKLHEDILSQSDYTVYFELRDRDRDKAAEKSEAMENAEEKIESLGKRRAIIEDFDRGEWVEFSTEDLERDIEHVSGDDGRANEVYEGLLDGMDVEGTDE